MEPINFDGANCVFGAEQPEYLPLPAERRGRAVTGEVLTCWQLTPEEIQTVVKTGKIWVSMLTYDQPLQPMIVAVEKPDIFDPE